MVSGMVGSVAAVLTMGSSELQGDAERDVGGVAADGAEHGPVFFVVSHFDDFVAGGAPDGRIVVHHQLERLAAVSAGGVDFFDGQGRAIEHHAAERFVAMLGDRAKEADAHFGEILQSRGGHHRARLPLYSTVLV